MLDPAVCALPDFSRSPSQWAEGFVAAQSKARQLIEHLLTTSHHTFTSLVLPIEQAEENAARWFSPLAHLSAVTDGPDVRAAYDLACTAATEHAVWVMDNETLYWAYKQVRDTDPGLDAWQLAMLRDLMRSYERRGIGLPEATKARLGEIALRLEKLSTNFARNVLEASEAWHLPLTASQVEGMPQSALAILSSAGQKHSAPHGYAATLHQPNVDAVLTYCEDRSVREQIRLAYDHRANCPGKGPDNMPIILETIALRFEKAQLCGYVDHATYVTSDNMSADPTSATKLLLDLRAPERPKAQKEWRQMEEFARDQYGITDLAAWDAGFIAERLRQSLFGFSAAEISEYLPYEKVLAGMLALASHLFSVRFERDTSVSTWHPDVEFYRMFDKSGAEVSGFYMDPFSRDGKRGGAWKSTGYGRLGASRSFAFLTCNAAPASAHAPALMKHSDVVTLFHEFGHGLHLMLGQSPYPSVDMRAVERDAIECPSQFFENFAWNRRVLRSFSIHHGTGETLPDRLLEPLIAARGFNAGMALVRQLVFGLTDLALHTGAPVSDEKSVWEIAATVREQTAVVPDLPGGEHILTAFTHLFAGGYSAGYYGYLWAEVLSEDVFSAFLELADPMDPSLGSRFSREILEVGAQRPFADSFAAFRGRAPQVEPLLASRGLLDP
jgi:oligopeptidase A